MGCRASASNSASDDDQLAEEDDSTVLRLAKAIGKQLPQGPRICILGGIKLNHPASEPFLKGLARVFSHRLCGRAVIVTGGMAGVQETFARALGTAFGSSLVHLVPKGQRSNYGVGEDFEAGATLNERMNIFAQLGDLYLTIEGGPGVAKEANCAFVRGAAVLPMIFTGGASSGKFDFPCVALERPGCINHEQWQLIKEPTSSIEDTVEAVADVTQGFVARWHEDPRDALLSFQPSEEAEIRLFVAGAVQSGQVTGEAARQIVDVLTGRILKQKLKRKQTLFSTQSETEEVQPIRSAVLRLLEPILNDDDAYLANKAEICKTWVKNLDHKLPQGPRVCILGSTTLNHVTTMPLAQALGQQFGARLPGKSLVVLTGGMPGVQEIFVRATGNNLGSSLLHLVYKGHASNYGFGLDMLAGANLRERVDIVGQIGDFYITIEGGPGVAKESRAAFRRGAAVLPVFYTGGASAGGYSFPERALERPFCVKAEQWDLLRTETTRPEAVAAALTDMVLEFCKMWEIKSADALKAFRPQVGSTPFVRKMVHTAMSSGELPPEVMAVLVDMVGPADDQGNSAQTRISL